MPDLNVFAQALAERFWTRTFLLALVVVSPKVLTTVATFALQQAFDRKVKAAATEYQALLRRSASLEVYTQSLENFELLRASFLIVLGSAGSDMDWAKRADKLYQQSMLSVLRRIAADLSPETWRARMHRTEEILGTDYDQSAVKELQGFRNEIDLEARAALTSLEGQMQVLADRRTAIEARRARWASFLDSVGTIAAIVVFFISQGNSPA